MVDTVQQQPPPPKISLLPNLWVIIPIVAVVVAIISANLLLLNYIHVFTAILWTGTDIFMAFLLGPVLRNVSLATRKEVISWLMPKMVFFMPTVAAVTTTAGYFLASRMGLITLNPPVVYWISTVLVIVSIMFIQGLGILLPTNLRIYFEMRKNEPDMSRIQRLMNLCQSSRNSGNTSIYNNLYNGRVCRRVLFEPIMIYQLLIADRNGNRSYQKSTVIESL